MVRYIRMPAAALPLAVLIGPPAAAADQQQVKRAVAAGDEGVFPNRVLGAFAGGLIEHVDAAGPERGRLLGAFLIDQLQLAGVDFVPLLDRDHFLLTFEGGLAGAVVVEEREPEAEVRPEANLMLTQVGHAVDTSNLCPAVA